MAKHPAAFINAIAEDGTKDEAVRYLQSTWDDLCDLRATVARLEKVEAAALNLVIDIRDQWGSLPDERLVKALESALAAKGET